MTDDKKKTGKRAPRRRGKPAAVPTAATTNSTPPVSVQASPAASRVLATVPIHVRWHDLDAFNHVNNASFLVLLEEARLQWLRGVPGEWFDEHAMPVMAAVELHYRKPITWPAEIDVLMSCERIGRSSITLGNRVVERDHPDCVYADGNVVLVWVDPANGASVPLPDAIRQACLP